MNDELNKIEEKLVNLEVKISYLEDFMNQIQQVVVLQEKTIEKLKKENKIFAEKIFEISESLEGEIPNRKPPHY